MMIFTTLFDSFYIDKGLAMYRSLERVTDDFKLYIYAFDDKAYEVLSDLNLEHAVILKKDDLEETYPILLKLKEERSKAEYCWTCTPISIEYVLEHFNEDNCTYIDSDLYFFKDPKELYDEIKEAGANIVITPHRFSSSLKDRRLCKRSGKYCVEFNYFDRSDNAREALTWWKERCFEWCYHIYEPERMGDQKYLEKFPTMFKGVHELQHLGGGIAPWNLGQYELLESTDPVGLMDSVDMTDSIDSSSEPFPRLIERASGENFDIIFYHFQNLRYLSDSKVNISSGTHSKKLKDAIYLPYLREVEAIRKELAQYGISFSVKKVYSSNKLIGFLQGTLLRFKIRSLSDVVDLKNI